MNGGPHGLVCGLFGGFHPYLGCNPSLSSDLMRGNCIFLKVARLANSMLLSVTLDFLSIFFSDEHFFIILAFFESVMFCL